MVRYKHEDTNNQKINQSGIAHIAILALIVIVGVVGFASYRVIQSNDDSNENSLEQQTDQGSEIGGIDSTAALEGEESVIVEEQTITNDQDDYEPGPKSGSQAVAFIKGGASADENVVTVSLQADQQLYGTCSFIFTQGGSTVTKTKDVEKFATCDIEVSTSEFPATGDWNVQVTYGSYDTVAYGSVSDISVTIPEPQKGGDLVARTINFTKGGGSQQGTDVVVAANMSEVQTGTCTFTFSLNGSVRVEETREISDSNRCEATIPVSEFPKSSTYSFALSFVSSDGLVTASQPAYDIVVL